jgi:hypothetical protein
MPPNVPAFRRRLVVGLVLGSMLAACGPEKPGGSSAVPPGSGSAACQTAPSVPDDLEGWGPPTTAPDLLPILISDRLVCGDNRVLITLLDKDGRPAGAPDRPVQVQFYNLGRSAESPIATTDGTFIWAIEDAVGVYTANVAFPEAGRYGAAFRVAAGDPIRLTFDVQPSSPVIKVGDRAPASKNPTLASVGGDVTHISTDPTPDPRLYETSVDEALAAHKPFVLVFATPKFCTSAQCGPTLDRIKPYLAKYPTVTFINVEPYRLKLVDGVLQADLDAKNKLQTAPTTDEWHLFNEPSVYVVNRDGIVTANFELIFSDQELTTALQAVK